MCISGCKCKERLSRHAAQVLWQECICICSDDVAIYTSTASLLYLNFSTLPCKHVWLYSHWPASLMRSVGVLSVHTCNTKASLKLYSWDHQFSGQLVDKCLNSLTLFLFYFLLKMLTIIWKWERECSEELSTRKADKQTFISCRVMVIYECNFWPMCHPTCWPTMVLLIVNAEIAMVVLINMSLDWCQQCEGCISSTLQCY